MAYKFSNNWAAEIAKVTTQRKYQTATVRILDVDSRDPANYNPVTNSWAGVNAPPLYEGQARVVPVRSGNQDSNAAQANPSTITAVRVQLPGLEGDPGTVYSAGDYGNGVYGVNQWSRIRRGCRVVVLNAPRNPALVNLVFTVTSDLQGASSASRTLHALFDSDAVLGV